MVHLPSQQGHWNENRGYELRSDHPRCAGSYDHITAECIDEQQVQRWYGVACVSLLTLCDFETLSETTFPLQRLHGYQNAFYTIRMSLLYG